MRPFLMAIATFFVFSSSAQTERLKVFKRTEYINGNFYRHIYDTIKTTNEPIDIYFLKKHFYFPYYLPDNFINVKNKNKTITVWRDPKGKKDYQKNRKNTYTYDSLGRVTKYSYSGCFVCSNFPYEYKVTYNKNGQVEQLRNTINSKDSFKFNYNENGDIIKVEKFLLKKLETEMHVVN